MKRIVLILITIFPYFSKGQSISNPSFEAHSYCPTNNGIFVASNWYWPANHQGTADYMNTCATMAFFSVPTSIFGYQFPYEGDAYVGMQCYHEAGVGREYIQTQLSTPLLAGNFYQISFFASLADDCKYAINNIGAALTNNPIAGNNGSGPLNVTPQVNSTAIISDKENWVEVSGIYQATGGEQFLTIGNFYGNSQTSKIIVNPTGIQSAYYYIDNVSISTILSVDDFAKDSTIEVYPNPFSTKLNFNSENDPIEQIKIYSNNRLIKEISGNVQSVDLSELPEGIYSLIAISTSQKRIYKKIIKK